MDVAIHAASPAILLALAGAPASATDEPPGAAATTQQKTHGAEPATAAGQDATSITDATSIGAIEATGRRIFEHDRAAAVATDVAMAQRAFKRDKRVRLADRGAGWRDRRHLHRRHAKCAVPGAGLG